MNNEHRKDLITPTYKYDQKELRLMLILSVGYITYNLIRKNQGIYKFNQPGVHCRHS